MAKAKSYRKKQYTTLASVYIVLTIPVVSWMFSIAWIILTSFRGEDGILVPYIIPKTFTLENYKVLLINQTGNFPFVRWSLDTLFISTASYLLSTFAIVTMAYALSWLHFCLRKPFLKVVLALNMFPGFMNMIAVYYILEILSLTENLLVLIPVYSAGSALGFYIAKGSFDTVLMALDEPATTSDANRWQTFTKITLPLSKPVTVYTPLTAFMGPWMDFIFAKVIMGNKAENYTVAIGLFSTTTKSTASLLFMALAVGCVLIAIPITILFILMQRFYVEGVTSDSVKG